MVGVGSVVGVGVAVGAYVLNVWVCVLRLYRHGLVGPVLLRSMLPQPSTHTWLDTLSAPPAVLDLQDRSQPLFMLPQPVWPYLTPLNVYTVQWLERAPFPLRLVRHHSKTVPPDVGQILIKLALLASIV